MKVMKKRMRPARISDEVGDRRPPRANSVGDAAEKSSCRVRTARAELRALPMTKVTAIVSPSARPIEHDAADDADLRERQDDVQETPPGRAADPAMCGSLRTGGTASNTSREIEVTNSGTMIARSGRRSTCRCCTGSGEQRRQHRHAAEQIDEERLDVGLQERARTRTGPRS